MRKKWIGVTILVIVTLLIGCSSNYVTLSSGNYMTSIYNDDERIASNTNTFNLTVQEQSIDGQQLSGEIEKLEGMATIWSIDSQEDMELDIEYLLNVTNGKLKLVLIYPDDSIIEIVERNEETTFNEYTIDTLQIKEGNNRIKMVGGKDTSFKFDIKIPSGVFKKLGLSRD